MFKKEDLLKYKFTLPYSKLETTIVEGDGWGDRLFSQRGKRTFEVVPDYLAKVVVQVGDIKNPTAEQILDLRVCDQEAISIENYIFNFGEILNLNDLCPRCGNPLKASRNLRHLEFVEPGKETISFKLPRSKISATIGMLSGHQEQLLLSLEANGQSDPNQADFQSLRELDGKPPVYEDVVSLPSRDHMAIRENRAKLICGYKTIALMSCVSCNYKEVTNFLMHRGFFFPGG